MIKYIQKKEEINDINFNDFDTEIYKNNESKTLNNNIPIYEEHQEENQDFTISRMNMSKKNNISNFLENNEFNCTNNDNDESNVKGFFLIIVKVIVKVLYQIFLKWMMI